MSINVPREMGCLGILRKTSSVTGYSVSIFNGEQLSDGFRVEVQDPGGNRMVDVLVGKTGELLFDRLWPDPPLQPPDSAGG